LTTDRRLAHVLVPIAGGHHLSLNVPSSAGVKITFIAMQLASHAPAADDIAVGRTAGEPPWGRYPAEDELIDLLNEEKQPHSASIRHCGGTSCMTPYVVSSIWLLSADALACSRRSEGSESRCAANAKSRGVFLTEFMRA